MSGKEIGGTNLKQAVIARARKEVQEERMEAAVQKLKVKYRERAAAKTVLDNLDREIEDLEASIEQGND